MRQGARQGLGRLASAAALLAWCALGCAPSLEVEGKDGCLSHADCVGGALCVEIAGAAEGRCVAPGTLDRPDAGVGADADTADASDRPDTGSGEDASGGEEVGVACVDEDRDGYGPGCSRGRDCDDSDPARHPGAAERCDTQDHNCDGDPLDGFDLTRDVANCGGCGQACAGLSARWSCEDSRCAVAGCVAGRVDANGDPADGCEAGCTATAVSEISCTDGLDDDCDSKVDAADPDCAVTRQLGGAWTGVQLVRGITPEMEITTLAQVVEVQLTNMTAQVRTTWVGSAALEGDGEAVSSLAPWEVRDQGEGRYTLTSPDTGASLRAFASREASPSWLIALPTSSGLGAQAWSRSLWLWSRAANVSAERFSGDYVGGVFRGRTRSLGGGFYVYEPTWIGDYAIQATGGNSRLLRERGASGRPPNDALYPLDLTIGRTPAGSWWMEREAASGWDVGYHGELAYGGNAGVFGVYDRVACDGDSGALQSRTCPPEAGISVLVKPDTAGVHSLQGRWALVGVWLSESATPYVSGTPTFLGVELTIGADQRIRGAGDFLFLTDLGRAEQDRSTIRLDIAGLPPTDGFEPSALALTGRLSADGGVVLLHIDNGDGVGPGLFWLVRL